ncbi:MULTISPECIES: KH domain-containing protein [unclassified Desulfovibrio]|uniref:KH domain-containing protein n=1 Tax=unclassified Desulfovibrio TaxID=2593640 RepID=UPI0019816505|nr:MULTISPECIES: KH domain-containing protein [unclassified Desulfovibrio]MDE7371222.1 KH domain-containing protein [Desulfovibrio sp.]
MMKALIENIARALVDDPAAVEVREVDGDQATVLELKVASDDLGKVIGRQGRTVRAMRTLLGAASIRAGRRTVLEILE